MIVDFDRKKLWIELIALFRLAAPAILTNFVNYGQGITDQIFVGHLSKEYTQEHSLATYISGMGLASTFVAVTYYFANGLIFCYDTTISQAFGAKNFKKIGLELQTGLFIVSIVSIPVGILWFYMDSILITLLGIEDDVASVIRIAGRILTISLWPSLMYDLLARFANNQGVVQPALYVGIVVLLLNAFFNWLFIYAFKLGYAGSPLATCTSRWISPILLFVLLYRQGLFRRSWFGLRIKEALAPSQVWNFFKLGLPAAGVIILEVTGFHLSTIFVTMMHNEVFLAAHIAVFSVLFAAFFVPLGVSVGCAQRVGSALGDARKDDAIYSAHVAQVSTFVLSLLVALILIILRHEIPFLLTSDETIVAVAADLLLLVAALHIADAYQVCAMATIRSTGRQVRGFGMNLLAYYIACPAFIALFVYVFDWSIYGVWAGLSLGVWILMGFLIVHNECVINWETEVDRARRAATGLTPLDTISVVDDVEQNASLLAADVLARKEENVDDIRNDSVDDSEHSDNKNNFDNNEYIDSSSTTMHEIKL